MRIGFLTTQWPGARLGGIGAYTLACANALAAAGHEPHVFTLTLPPDVRAALPAGIILHEVDDLAARVQAGILPGPLAAAIHAGGEGIYRLALGALLCDAARKVHAAIPLDVLEAPEYEGLAVPLLLNPIAGLPVITHLHSGSAIRRHGNGDPETPDQHLLESLEFASILLANALCAPSNAVVNDTRRFCPINRDVRVIGLPFQADPSPFTPPDANAPILYVGRLEQIKGVALLPAALSIFLNHFPNSHIRLVGPDTATAPGGGSMAAWLLRQLDPKLLPCITIAGERSGAELAEEYRNAAFCIVPSLHESYSYVTCEALAAGRAVIVASDTGAAEVAADASLVFYRGNPESLAAAMIRLASDRSLLETLSRRAFDRGRTTLSTTLPQRIAFYESMSQHSTPNPASALQHLPPSHITSLLQAITRLTTTLAGIPDPSHLTPGTRLLTIMSRMAANSNAPTAQVLLYGAGRHTARLLAEKHLWEQAGHRIIGLIDDHPRFASSPTAWNLPVESLATLTARLPLQSTNIAVVLSTDTFQDPFWSQTSVLRDKGVAVFRLYD